MPVGRTPIIDLDNHLVDDLASWGEWVEEEWRSLLPKKIPGTADEQPRTLVGERIMMGSEVPNQRVEIDLRPGRPVQVADRSAHS